MCVGHVTKLFKEQISQSRAGAAHFFPKKRSTVKAFFIGAPLNSRSSISEVSCLGEFIFVGKPFLDML